MERRAHNGCTVGMGPMPTIDDCDPWPEPPKRGRKQRFNGRLPDGAAVEIKRDMYSGAWRFCEGCGGHGLSKSMAGGWVRCSRKCFGGSRRMQATAAILEHACERSAMPRIPAALLFRRVIEVLPAFGMDGEIPDEWTGRRGIVTTIHASGDVDLEMEFGGEVSVYHSRLRTLGSLRR